MRAQMVGMAKLGIGRTWFGQIWFWPNTVWPNNTHNTTQHLTHHTTQHTKQVWPQHLWTSLILFKSIWPKAPWAVTTGWGGEFRGVCFEEVGHDRISRPHLAKTVAAFGQNLRFGVMAVLFLGVFSMCGWISGVCGCSPYFGRVQHFFGRVQHFLGVFNIFLGVFNILPAPIFVHFPLLGVFSWNFGGVLDAGALKCAGLEFSGCRVKPRVFLWSKGGQAPPSSQRHPCHRKLHQPARISNSSN